MCTKVKKYSQQVADKWGIMITTSHCEPLLFNNAAPSEWNKQRDGEWNYETNSTTILKKLDNRIRETAQYDNIYTMGMRGLHDEAMKGSTDPKERARTLEKVFAEQRAILEKYKHRKAKKIPQIFVPYKETLYIYDAGLRNRMGHTREFAASRQRFLIPDRDDTEASDRQPATSAAAPSDRLDGPPPSRAISPARRHRHRLESLTDGAAP